MNTDEQTRETPDKPRWGLAGPLSDHETFLAHPTPQGLLYAPDRESYILRAGILLGAGVIDLYLSYLLTWDLGVTLFDQAVLERSIEL